MRNALREADFVVTLYEDVKQRESFVELFEVWCKHQVSEGDDVVVYLAGHGCDPQRDRRRSC